MTWGPPETDAIPAFLVRNAEHAPDKVVHVCDGAELTNASLLTRSTELANGLISLGVEPGTAVASFMQNALEHSYAWGACSLLGAVHAPTNTLLRGEFLRHQLGTTAASVVLVDPDLVEAVLAVADQLPNLRHLVVRGAGGSGGSGGAAARSITVHSTDELRALGGGRELATQRVALGTDLNTIIFTGGTTGPSKGVAETQAYMVAQMRCTQRCNLFTSDDTYFSPFPMYHINAFGLSLVLPVIFQGKGVTTSRFSVTSFWDDCRAAGATHISAFGPLYLMLWNMPERPDDADNPVRYSVGYCPDQIWDGFEKRFGLQIGTTYALSECIMVAYAPVDDPVPRGWAGRPNPDLEVRMLDDDDVEVATGEVGEVSARPLRPNVMFSGYYNNPSATAEVWRNLWFHTGDLGRVSPEGYVAFVDRKADYLRRLGENISTYEVEQAILLHPSVLEVAVHAVPSDLGEDEAKAVVIVMPGQTVDATEFFAFCTEQMPRYAVPRYLEIVEQLPRSPVGRVQKFALRQRGITAATVDRTQL